MDNLDTMWKELSNARKVYGAAERLFNRTIEQAAKNEWADMMDRSLVVIESLEDRILEATKKNIEIICK